MTSMIDQTHDAALTSWVESANWHADFPIQNLPLGIFSPAGGAARGGVAIGDSIVDVPALLALGLLTGEAAVAAEAMRGDTLNGLMALGATPRQALRQQLSALLAAGASQDIQARAGNCLYAAADCVMHLPARIGDYTDFYVGIHHATNIGRVFRPDNPLLPNYKHLPIGYHGRASSVRVSGLDVQRPLGQFKPPADELPQFGPCKRLDYELELGVWIGPGNALGESVPIAEAVAQIAGFCLLNDWSARDIQAWEYQPLGPFLSKNFHSTISAWVITPEALAPFALAQARPEGDPPVLPYLTDADDAARGGLDIALNIHLRTAAMKAAGLAPVQITDTNARHMYWSVRQMIAHHTVGGCNLQPGDLLGTGTISGPERTMCGALLETTQGGKAPLALPNGESRTFLEDGDEVFMSAHARRDGFASIGFGACHGAIVPAKGAAA